MATKSNCPCLEKVGEHEPIFVLRAQDETASLVVAVWACLNAVLAKARANGQSDQDLDLLTEEIGQDILEVFKPYRVEWPDTDFSDPALTPKLKEAFACASDMVNWPKRKYPD